MASDSVTDFVAAITTAGAQAMKKPRIGMKSQTNARTASTSAAGTASAASHTNV
jgi:hypothetical protein